MSDVPGVFVIELPVRSVDALIDTQNSPLVSPRVHPEAAEEIWCEAGRRPGRQTFLLRVGVPQGDLTRADEVRQVLQNYFCHAADDATRAIGNVFREGWRNLVIALAVVAVVMGFAWLVSFWNDGLIARAAGVVVWVALWNPVELLLYEHLPIRRRRALARALRAAEIEVVAR
jgi:hypothetical protein